MKLLWALFRWIFSRILVLLAIGAMVVLFVLLRDWWKERQFQELQLQRLQTELGELNQEFRKIRSDLTLEKQYMALREKEPSRWTAPLDWYQWNKEMEMLGALIGKKNAELKKLREQKAQLVKEVQSSSQKLYQMQQLLSSTLRRSVKTILILCALVFLGPICWRAFWYFVIAGLARHARPIRLISPSNGNPSPENVTVQPSKKNLPVVLQPGESLVTRMAWLHQYAPMARKRTRFLLDWKSPFISYAAGLSELTEVTVPSDGTTTEIALSSGENPDTFLCEVQLHDHPGFVVYPSQVVALSGNLRLETKWTFTNLHSWIAGRLRHILIKGTGKIFIQGSGGAEQIFIGDQGLRISESIITAFEATLAFSTVRTETFWPYYRRLVPLFDYQFEGNGILLRQISHNASRLDSSTVRVFDVILNGAGKLLGL